MRLELSSEGRYAMRALLYLASVDERVSAATIAVEASIPPRLLARILASLARAGLVASKAGRDGGATLARPAGAITLRDIVEAIEGPFAVSTCILESRVCDGSNRCAMHDAWIIAQHALLAELERRTLDELVETAERKGRLPGAGEEGEAGSISRDEERLAQHLPVNLNTQTGRGWR